MRVIKQEGRILHLALSRKNLESLLTKLDGIPENSACTIFKELPEGVFFVKAEEDAEHYQNGITPGEMHPETEAAITQLRLGQ